MSHDPFSPSSAAKPPSDKPAEQAPAAPEEVETPESNAPPQTSPEDAQAPLGSETDAPAQVPPGTTKEVLEWVGGDKERAAAALAVEHGSSEPRKGLTRQLEELLRDDSGS